MTSKSKNRSIVLLDKYLDDLAFWIRADRKVALRIMELIEAIKRDPFEGIGKPEPLRFKLKGYWSRRITREHRLVYRVFDDKIVFVQARFHYE